MSLLTTSIPEGQLVSRGKVRDIYEYGDKLLLVATDRISAFDVVLPTPIPGKGAVLTRLSEFWFRRTSHIIGNHLVEMPLERALPDPGERARVGDRAMVVRRLQPLPLEAVVRGYLIGSGWRDYQDTGSVSGIRLPRGLQQAERLAEPIFTPSSKAAAGEHDQNVTFPLLVDSLGKKLATRIRDLSIRIYRDAAAYALGRGIIIADTKFEFGLGGNGELVLIDELLTPDSSRFWPLQSYKPGKSQASLDKQFVRDYLLSSAWDRALILQASEEDQDLVGKFMTEAAEMRGMEPVDLYLDRMAEDKALNGIGQAMHEEDVKALLKHPLSMVGTDGMALPADNPYKTHPRSYGTFPKILRKYVREERVLTLEEAVRKMTSAGATKLGIMDRGILRPGFHADVTVFDPLNVRERATYDDPIRLPEGIEYVFVNGVLTIEQGKHTGALAGKPLKHRSAVE